MTFTPFRTTNASQPPATPWIAYRRAVREPRFRLFCFPYAAGSASFYRDWGRSLPPEVDVCPVQLPGRDRRISEKPYTAIAPLVEELTRALRPYLDVPFGFFGHSMGALISFELARELRRTGAEPPRWLFLSGARAPQVPRREPSIHDLPDAEFIDEIRQLNGTPAEVLDEPELLELYLPLLRADVGLCERYSYAEEAPLEVPFSVYGGEQDPDVLHEDLAAWRMHTTRRTQVRNFPGDHFFLAQHRDSFLRSFSDDLFQAMFFAHRRSA